MTTPPTILFLLPDLGGGGAQRVMLTLAGHLDRARFTPRLAVLGREDALAHGLPAGVPVGRADAERLRAGLPWLARHIRALRPDAVVSTLAYTNLALLALKPLLPRGTKLIVREANRPEATLQSLPSFLPARVLYRLLYPRAASVIAQSGEIAGELRRLAPAAADSIRVLPNPVDVAALRAGASVPQRAPGAGLRLVGAGRLTRQKGFDRVVEIAARLPADARVTVFGEGPERAALEARIRALELQDRVVLAGFTNTLAAHLAGADALLMPSRWEGLPNAALEALAVGTPVLASPEAALSEVARLAPRSVTVAADDEGFVRALANWPQAGALDAPRASLLPRTYEATQVAEAFQNLLAEALAG